MGANSYSEQIDIDNTYRLRMLISTLPPYAKDYFRGIQPHTESRTRIAYAYDLNVFFSYLHENNPIFAQKEIRDITLDDLEKLRPTDIEEYLEYLQAYTDPKSEGSNNTKTNHELGLKRKLASLRSFYRYFIQHEDIMYNPVDLVTMPKVHDKAITRLDIDEVALLLDQAESGDKLSEREQRFHDRTKLRDVALLTLMLGTGIRVSECVGLNIDDVDFKNDGIRIHRKGGKEVVVVRAVEKLVKKYAQTVTTVKHITPHKLRSTYGTNLYRETGDIYLVADVLGHNDVNTTKKHYAALEDDRRRGARNAVKLRD